MQSHATLRDVGVGITLLAPKHNDDLYRAYKSRMHSRTQANAMI